MSLLSAYATAAEYRDRTNKTDTSDDTDILEQITAASRMLEYELRRAPGFFNASASSQVRYFTPLVSSKILRLEDERGLGYCISTIATDGIAVDTDGDGTYNYTIDPTGESWVVGRPYNSAANSEPFDSFELRPLSAASFTTWPTYPLGVRITGTWGWSAVPDMIRELVVKMARDMRDSEEAGAAGSLSGVALKTDTWRLWLSAKQQYGSPSLVFA